MGVWRLQELASTTHDLATIDNEKLQLAVRWRQTIDLNWVRTKAAMLDADVSKISMWQRKMDQTSEISVASRNRLIELVKSDEGKALLAKIDAQREAYRTPRAALLKRKAAGEDVQSALERELKPLADIYSDSITALERRQQGIYDATLAAAEREATYGRVIMLVFGSVSLLLGSFFALTLTRSIVRPIRRASENARFISEGDLARTIEIDGRDEVAELLLSLEEMQGSLVKIVASVRSGSESIAAASAEIAQGNHDLSARTESQASALEETASSMDADGPGHAAKRRFGGGDGCGGEQPQESVGGSGADRGRVQTVARPGRIYPRQPPCRRTGEPQRAQTDDFGLEAHAQVQAGRQTGRAQGTGRGQIRRG